MTRDKHGKLNFFYGPLPKSEAEDIVERMFDEPKFPALLVEFLQHDLAPGELEYAIQIMAESIEEFVRESKQDDYDDEHAAALGVGA